MLQGWKRKGLGEEQHAEAQVTANKPRIRRKGVMRMPPLAFSDEEMNTLSALASALPPLARDAFLSLLYLA